MNGVQCKNAFHCTTVSWMDVSIKDGYLPDIAPFLLAASVLIYNARLCGKIRKVNMHVSTSNVWPV